MVHISSQCAALFGGEVRRNSPLCLFYIPEQASRFGDGMDHDDDDGLSMEQRRVVSRICR